MRAVRAATSVRRAGVMPKCAVGLPRAAGGCEGDRLRTWACGWRVLLVAARDLGMESDARGTVPEGTSSVKGCLFAIGTHRASTRSIIESVLTARVRVAGLTLSHKLQRGPVSERAERRAACRRLPFDAVAGGVTPRVSEEKRGFSPGSGKRPAVSFLQQLGAADAGKQPRLLEPQVFEGCLDVLAKFCRWVVNKG